MSSHPSHQEQELKIDINTPQLKLVKLLLSKAPKPS